MFLNIQGSESLWIIWFRSTSSSFPLPHIGLITSSPAWASCDLFYLTLKMKVKWYSKENKSGTTRCWAFSFIWQVKKMRIIASWSGSWLSAGVTKTFCDAVVFLCLEMWSNGILKNTSTQRWCVIWILMFSCSYLFVVRTVWGKNKGKINGIIR